MTGRGNSATRARTDGVEVRWRREVALVLGDILVEVAQELACEAGGARVHPSFACFFLLVFVCLLAVSVLRGSRRATERVPELGVERLVELLDTRPSQLRVRK
jgi:hypothetical protein